MYGKEIDGQQNELDTFNCEQEMETEHRVIDSLAEVDPTTMMLWNFCVSMSEQHNMPGWRADQFRKLGKVGV